MARVEPTIKRSPWLSFGLALMAFVAAYFMAFFLFTIHEEIGVSADAALPTSPISSRGRVGAAGDSDSERAFSFCAGGSLVRARGAQEVAVAGCAGEKKRKCVAKSAHSLNGVNQKPYPASFLGFPLISTTFAQKSQVLDR